MASGNEHQTWIEEELTPNAAFLQKFRLYETRSKFYMIGWDKNRTFWRVLKIDRLEPSQLNIFEDSTTYSEIECCDLLKRIHEGNKSTGGLKFVTTCYGIVGVIKFLGPYYMLLITKRRKIGRICGHAVYAITKSEMIPIPNSTVRSNMAYSKNENRYKKLLCTVDLTKDFFFSYSYHVMYSLQKNLCNHETGHFFYETMFVWNEFLTRGIRNHLKNALWTVALVYGFFKQVGLSISGRDFKLALIARRSCHYAGTRYLKRGSVVQNRGSIPLFWSQETSRLNIKPDIILSKKDLKYEATRLHFENLVKRYGNPIIILNLIKTREKKPRESILCAEFANAIDFINRDLTEENRLKFLHWDINKHSRNKATNVLALLGKGSSNWSYFENNYNGDYSLQNLSDKNKDAHNLETKLSDGVNDVSGNQPVKPPMFQKGVLRTNCIDCLDRTNVAQYAYGQVALGHQLHALGFIDVPSIDLDSPLVDDVMRAYETMGDTLALQYGGSAAHNKIFSERRGQWKAATQSQEFFRSLQRYYSNAYMDAEKQDAINVFLGHFQPQQGKPALWELDSDQHYNIGSRSSSFTEENARSFIRRSLSDGNILCESNSPIEATNIGQNEYSNRPLSNKMCGGNKGLSELTPEISTRESDVSYSRYTPSMSCRQLFPDTAFLHLEIHVKKKLFERSTFINSAIAGLSSDSVVNGLRVEASTSASESGSGMKGREEAGIGLTYAAAQNSDILTEVF
ncbi:hypothetical protein F0562_024228 [Nyssa sinensis]|uniref:SAC domain-containing protein n=1 Tax=Nyssa sinensis TaxID=561372 RepID=A0A5J5BBW2_9ASTE|nr:hypothetical protein F0562_024228 [Nyssa sinensis]